jgi:hypothetical protein
MILGALPKAVIKYFSAGDSEPTNSNLRTSDADRNGMIKRFNFKKAALLNSSWPWTGFTRE